MDLSLQLIPTTTLVQLASDAGLLKDPAVYEEVKVTSDVIANAVPTSLDVCGARGIITVCTDGNTLHLYSPYEDDDEEEEEEEENEDEDL